MANAAEDLEFNPYFKALQVRSGENELARRWLAGVNNASITMLFFQVRFSSLYERAQQNCWLVCIPATPSLQTCSISKQFTGNASTFIILVSLGCVAEKHILEPSVLFRE